jgi:hypothetical protein
MIKWLARAMMILCIASEATAATVRFENYNHPRDDWERTFNQLYLDGLKDGFIAANSALVLDGNAPLFCLPPKLALTQEQAEDIMMRQAKSVVPKPDMPISVILLAGLRDTFPCEGRGK